MRAAILRLGCIIVVIATAALAVADEIPLSERRSGYDMMSRDTKAMQDDDTANPAMLWVLEGETLWNAKAANGKSCADCHGDASASMKGVAARYPAFDTARGQPVDLEQRINICRGERQNATPLPFESRELLALTAFIARQSRGMPIEQNDPRMQPVIASGRALFEGRQGQLNLSCAQCHNDNWGKELAGSVDPAGASDRISDLSAGMAKPRIAAAAVAQLRVRPARRDLPARRAGRDRARGVSDVARPRHADGRARGAAVIRRPTIPSRPRRLRE